MKYKLYENSLQDIKNVKKTVLLNRGIEDYDTYLNLTDDVIIPYKKLDNIDKAVNCFENHFNNNDKISILIDEDVDGFTSAAIMYMYIKKLNEDYPVEYILHKKPKSHGLNEYGEIISVPKDTKLLIIPDAGTNDFKECEELYKDMDIIILDHHEKEFENPFAIIVNNQISKDYSNKNLCGVGVVYKFLQALDESLWSEYADDFLDLVALGNISDSMDIRSLETKRLIDKGLLNIKNECFKALIKKQEYSIKDEISIHNIQWYITPIINGIIRFGSIEEKDLLFKAFTEQYDEFEYTKRATKNNPTQTIIENIYDRVARLCSNAKSRQDNKRKKATVVVKELLDGKLNEQDKVVMVDVTDVLDSSLTGVVAIKIADTYNMPCILLRKQNDTKYGGSMRVPNNCPVHNFKDIINSCDSFNNCMGHQSAAGVDIDINNAENGKSELNEKLKDIDYDKTYFVDFILDCECADLTTIRELTTLSNIVGQGIDEPSIAITNIVLNKDDIELLGKNSDTISFKIDNVKYIIFNCDEDHPIRNWLENCWSEDESIEFELVGTPSINDFNGFREIQIIVKDVNVTKINEENKSNKELENEDDFEW